MKFENIIESADPQLEGFFKYMMNLVIPGESFAHKKSTSRLQIDDYHAIHGIRRPDTTSTSSANHFATCVAKPVLESQSVLLVHNNISIHNPANIEAPRICWHLINNYTGIFDIPYFERQLYWVSQNRLVINELDRIDALMQGLHSVEDYIKAITLILSINNKTRHLDNCVAPLVADWPGQLFVRKALYMKPPPRDIEPFLPILGPLHLSLNSREHVFLVHYSFFEKLFHFVFGSGKTLAKKPRPWRINLILELTRNGWVKIRDKIIEKFGKMCKDLEYRTTIDLLNNIVPATLDIYANLFRASLFDEYVETVFRIWTFALWWKWKNYNKAPLAFLSDVFYWKDKDHPFFDIIRMHLPYFNEYYVENTHSRIRANTSPNATVDNIIKQAYVIMNHNSAFKDNYHKTRRYPYTLPALDLLDKKTSLFLLEYFQDLFYNRGKSGPKLKKKRQKPKVYHLATLGKDVDLRRLPTAYSSSYLPQPNMCDRCKHPFSEEDGMVLICGHGYHLTCYNRKCNYCEEFYKKVIFKNVNKFLERLEGEDKLTPEDFDDDENTEKEEEEETSEEIEGISDISSILEAKIGQIIFW
ncbi:hypothetical protein C2G38_2184472 [Gigaspora rosea]|uniref:RING-type domain-containing protein n=1 Tax=Gigaspora rosea TaxID=44941 RepID=A0A397VF51_9GLOM|nr:hypothetical protein C2G38_2184472 [Gigaspora rosea]